MKFDINKKYKVGDTVTILDDLGKRYKSFDEFVSDAGVAEEMLEFQGSIVEIKYISQYYRVHNNRWNWSSNMFKESYIEDQEDLKIPKPGTFYYHKTHGKNILFKFTELYAGDLKFKYIDRRDTFNTDPTDEDNFHYTYKVSYLDAWLSDSHSLYKPSNEELYRDWKVMNEENEIKSEEQGMLQIPSFFSNSKYPIKSYMFYDSKNNFHKKYLFKLNDKLFVNYDKSKYTSYNNIVISSSNILNKNDYKYLLMNWAKCRIKSLDRTIELFKHKTRKEAMFEKQKADKKLYYKITNVIFNASKDGKYYHVVELNDGEINMKFLLDDLEIIMPNVNNYVLPKDRTIDVGIKCKVKVIDKYTPVKKDTEVVIKNLYNKHKPHNPWLRGKYDENTIALVSSDDKQFELKVKQLKRL